jgi:anaerobic ribonucleoside-triphosphate reductase activating protein
MDEETIVEIVRSNPLCRGVTFSGGEPFAQAEGFAKLARLLKSEGYEVASYSGYTFEQLLKGNAHQRKLLESIDILIDGPFLMEEKTLEISFRGSRNQRILDVPTSLKEGKAIAVTKGRWLGEY